MKLERTRPRLERLGPCVERRRVGVDHLSSLASVLLNLAPTQNTEFETPDPKPKPRNPKPKLYHGDFGRTRPRLERLGAHVERLFM